LKDTLDIIQTRFTRCLRDPIGVPIPPDLPAQRVQIYQDLVFRNLDSLLTSNFPVVQSTITPGDWETLIRGFIRDYQATTPHFPLLPQEFLGYLQDLYQNDVSIFERYPFIWELAHYEWVELDVQIAKTPETPELTAAVQANDALELNATAHVSAYEWPVHQIGPEFIPTERPETPTFLAVFLNANADCEFMSLTPLAALLLENIEHHAAGSLADHVAILERQHGSLSPQNLFGDTVNLVRRMQTRGLVLCQAQAG
jgi:hypothetical protein